ncbi:MAG: DUF2975 domain-containing protein [Gemmatimonadales bacterium]|nr:DUF2975 domain-containing protein [Gemmatimonadales bacterium]NIN10151.1 DUF2975 domain-containing protein [Gemmatimonadales bacterium]NIN48818.1 DUF2975 domain-containing protein [Gemmatimonadales bacterium]NIP06282.1 DUF2975 domain-containing protein [Gemmatimonadales bacterium]NIQ99258.1 DUF2975 domain-containing protein [Gemmatimonadales bacterium]
MSPPKLVTARIVKFWFDIVFFVGLTFGGLLALWLLLSPLTVSSSETPSDAAIPVAIGAGSIRPVLPLDAEASTAISNLRILEGKGELRFQTTSWTIHFATNLVWLLVIAVVTYVVYLLRSILRTVIADQPFAAANISRLRIIGLILIGTGILFPIVQYLAARMVLNRIDVQGVALSPPLEFGGQAILGGLLILVLATIFRYGTQLEKDQSLTV